MAMHMGAPLVVGNVARSLLQGESNALGLSATLDDTFSIFTRAVGSQTAS
jgi:hypothetical protein